jgi:hypothetical protein
VRARRPTVQPIDAMRLGISPLLLGHAESLLSGIDLLNPGYRLTRHVPGSKASD